MVQVRMRQGLPARDPPGQPRPPGDDAPPRGLGGDHEEVCVLPRCLLTLPRRMLTLPRCMLTLPRRGGRTCGPSPRRSCCCSGCSATAAAAAAAAVRSDPPSSLSREVTGVTRGCLVHNASPNGHSATKWKPESLLRALVLVSQRHSASAQHPVVKSALLSWACHFSLKLVYPWMVVW
jgi:hypothetical protein